MEFLVIVCVAIPLIVVITIGINADLRQAREWDESRTYYGIPIPEEVHPKFEERHDGDNY